MVFVYNVDASPIALFKDVYAGITDGSTDCNLCDLTFGRLLKDRSWKRFIAGLPLEATFEMRSTFCKRPDVPSTAAFPAVFVEAAAGLVELIGRDELDAVEDLESLRSLVAGAVEGLVP